MMHRTKKVTTAILMTFAVAACSSDSPTAPPAEDPVLWSAALAPEGENELSGSLSAESANGSFAAVLEIVDGPADQDHFWYIGTGAVCGDLELRLGEADDYPDFTPDENGEASAEATLDEELDAQEEYHVAIFVPGQDEGEPTLVACGVLESEDEDEDE